MTRYESPLKALRRIYESKIGDKMKSFENTLWQVLPNQAYLIRLDGVSFHKFLKNVQKPFDCRIADAMILTAADLLQKFNAVTAYTQSDEITLVFLNVKSDDGIVRNHSYNGRVGKLSTCTASYAAARFNHHLKNQNWTSLDDHSKSMLLADEAYFDSRVVIMPNIEEIVECLKWRSNLDGFRNGVTHVAQFHYGHNGTFGKSCQDLLKQLESDGIDLFEKYHPRYFFGSFIKKERFEFDTKNLKSGETVSVMRKRLASCTVNLDELQDSAAIELVTSPFFPSFVEPIPLQSPIPLN